MILANGMAQASMRLLRAEISSRWLHSQPMVRVFNALYCVRADDRRNKIARPAPYMSTDVLTTELSRYRLPRCVPF